MTDLATDTAVAQDGDGWTAEVTDNWTAWTPNGGYLAAIALRSAFAAADDPELLPASLECHFLRPARPGPVRLTVRTMRAGRRARSFAVEMRQDGEDVLAAMVWLIRSGQDGLAARSRSAPPAAAPGELASLDDLMATVRGAFSCWDRVEERPVADRERYGAWPSTAVDDPVRRSWVRLRPAARAAEPITDAARSLVLIDLFPFVAATMIHTRAELTHIAPTLSLSVSFHALQPDSEWLLLEASSGFSGGGTVAGEVTVWGEDRRLVASGIAQMLYRAVT